MKVLAGREEPPAGRYILVGLLLKLLPLDYFAYLLAHCRARAAQIRCAVAGASPRCSASVAAVVVASVVAAVIASAVVVVASVVAVIASVVVVVASVIAVIASVVMSAVMASLSAEIATVISVSHSEAALSWARSEGASVIPAASAVSVPAVSAVVCGIECRSAEIEICAVRVACIDAESPHAVGPYKRTVEICR